jgi:gliding motility-associated-like protein
MYVVSYSNGVCSDKDSALVCVYPAAVANASADTAVQFEHPVTLTVAGTGPFTWSPSNSLSCSTCTNPIANAEETTTYIVSTTNAYGCSASDEVTVTVYYVIIIPNIITPNQDGQNDNFRIIGLPPNSAVQIYNRWGNLMFTTTSYLNDWSTGTDGVYYYVLTTPDGKNYNGFVHVNSK